MLSLKYRKLKMRIFQVFSVVALAVLTWFVFKNKDGFQYIFGDFSYVWSELFSKGSQYLILALVLIMMLINWSFEALKWKRVIRSIQRLSFAESFKSVLAGLAVGFFVPNRVGEFAGKSLMLEKSKFWKASVLAFYTSFAQLFTTAFWGMLSLILFSELISGLIPLNIHFISVAAVIVIIVLLLLVYFQLNRLSLVFRRFKRIYSQIVILNDLKVSDKFYVLGMSFIRFFVFTSQYIILLYLLGISLPIVDAFLVISMLYLVLMVMPTIALTELPARSTLLLLILIAWFDLNHLSQPDALELRIIIASTLIWLINIALPAIIGAFFIPGFSIFKRKKS